MSAQTVLSTLEEISDYGAENSLEYLNGQVALKKAENSRESLFLIENTTLSATGELEKIQSMATESPDSWGVAGRIDIPLVDQLSLSGSINSDGEGRASLTLKPLSHSDRREQSDISCEKALISAEAARKKAESAAVTTALEWMYTSMSYKNQRLKTELLGTAYHDDKIRYDLREITFDELQDSMITWSEARVSLSEIEKEYRKTEISLYSALGASKEDVTVQLIDNDTLEKAILQLQEELDRSSGDYRQSSLLKLSALSRESAEAALENTWVYEPDFYIEGSVKFDENGYRGFTASMTFSLSLDDVRATEKDISRGEYHIAILEEIQSRNEAELEYNQILERIESSSLNREIARIEYDQAQILLSEAQILRKRGDISELDLEEIRLFLNTRENGLFRALADQYLAWFALKAYL